MIPMSGGRWKRGGVRSRWGEVSPYCKTERRGRRDLRELQGVKEVVCGPNSCLRGRNSYQGRAGGNCERGKKALSCGGEAISEAFQERIWARIKTSQKLPRDSGESIFAARHQDVLQGPLGWGVGGPFRRGRPHLQVHGVVVVTGQEDGVVIIASKLDIFHLKRVSECRKGRSWSWKGQMVNCCLPDPRKKPEFLLNKGKASSQTLASRWAKTCERNRENNTEYR